MFGNEADSVIAIICAILILFVLPISLNLVFGLSQIGAGLILIGVFVVPSMAILVTISVKKYQFAQRNVAEEFYSKECSKLRQAIADTVITGDIQALSELL